MSEDPAVSPVDVLAALADLSPASSPRAASVSIPTEWFHWMRIRAAFLFGLAVTRSELQPDGTYAEHSVNHAFIERDVAERLAAVAQVRSVHVPLRAGWLFVTGRAEVDGVRRQVFHPLVTVGVRVSRPASWGDGTIHRVGDLALTPRIDEGDERVRLERDLDAGSARPRIDGSMLSDRDVTHERIVRDADLQRFARRVASAAGFGPDLPLVAVDAGDSPEVLSRKDGLRVVAAVGVYAAEDLGGPTRAGSLRAWMGRPVDAVTAFHSLYRPDPEPTPSPEERQVDSPYVLTPAQAEAVVRTRSSAITVVSGAPGTGKSHTLAAIAADAMSRGETVLVAAKTDATVDALLDLLERAPGPTPVVFGSAERREQLATLLSGGQLLPTPGADLAAAGQAVQDTMAERDDRRALLTDRLAAEAGRGGDGRAVERARVAAPGLFDPGVDLVAVGDQLASTSATGGSWFARRRRRKAWQALATRLGVGPTTTPSEVAALLATARVARAGADLVEAGGLTLDALVPELQRSDDAARQAMARWLAAQSRSAERLDGRALGAVAALATSLRSGRAARRDQLARMDPALTRALPLWLGTLADIEDLLPAHPGLFDLVMIDEASSIEQPLAIPALLRGRRVVVAGDPRQLRHVSFVADERHREVMAAHGIDRVPVLAARLDVRRNSLFDVAAGAAPVTVLDEHFRSDPHLVELVARRLYDGRLSLATRTPVTECRDCLRVVRVEGDRDEAGVVHAEIEAVLAELRARKAAGGRSVGVVTPFRAQADAIEAAVLATFTADELEALDLRVGTVHGFQGNERDVVVVSLGIGTTGGAQPWTFVDDPHLFAVLATRARREVVVVHAADPPAGSLVGEYLAQNDVPPPRAPSVAAPRDWVAEVAARLTSAGVPVRPSYPTGRHVVDLCLDDPHRAVAVECLVHPDGAAAHLERRLALERAGWEVFDAFPSRWSDREGELVLHLLSTLGRT